jgi:hypothetical protein
LKNDVNLSSKNNKQKNSEKNTFVGALKVNDENSRIRKSATSKTRLITVFATVCHVRRVDPDPPDQKCPA